MIDILIIILIESLDQYEAITTDVNTTLRFTYTCDGEFHSIDPIGFAFIVVFGFVLVLQFLGMFAHRLFSLLQIVSSTSVVKKVGDRLTETEDIVALIKTLGRLGSQDDADSEFNVDTIVADDFEEDYISDTVKRTGTLRHYGGTTRQQGTGARRYSVVNHLTSRQNGGGGFKTMDAAFADRYEALRHLDQTMGRGGLTGILNGRRRTEPALETPSLSGRRRPSAHSRRPSRVHKPAEFELDAEAPRSLPRSVIRTLRQIKRKQSTYGRALASALQRSDEMSGDTKAMGWDCEETNLEVSDSRIMSSAREERLSAQSRHNGIANESQDNTPVGQSFYYTCELLL